MFLFFRWKIIANEFEGRKNVKNIFFGFLRKSLRLICKILGRKRNSDIINGINGSVLIDFIDQKVFVDFGENKSLNGIDEFYFGN